MLGLLLFGIPSALIANAKGFEPFRWFLALGFIGFLVILFMPSARSAGLAPDEAFARAAKGNSVGKWLCVINVLTIVSWLLIRLLAMVPPGVL